MLRRIFSISLFLLNLSIGMTQVDFIPGQIILHLNPGSSPGQIIRNLQSEYNNLSILTVISSGMGLYLLQTDPGSEQRVIRSLKLLPEVNAVQLNHKISNREKLPDDPFFSEQWALKNTGQSGGLSGADIGAPAAWQISTGGITKTGDTIVLAIVDDGFQLDHPDLEGNFFVNYSEIPENGLDDDGNGYIDDVKGWNAYNSTGVLPVRSHGTHNTGIMAARGNNNIGVTGINWNIKILAVAGSSENEAIAVASYVYVAEMRRLYNQTNGNKGAFVVATNSSFGVNLGKPADFPIWCSLYDTLGKYGILNVAATTNSNINIDLAGDIPTTCASEFLISVTNSTSTDEKNISAGFGPVNIDLAAPGTNIYSTNTSGGFGMRTGTSMAAPHVTGTIGLIYAVLSEKWLEKIKAKPDSTALIIKDMLFKGSAEPGTLSNLVCKGRRVDLHGTLQEVIKRNEEILNLEQPFTRADIDIMPNPAGKYIQIKGEEESYLNAEIMDFSGRIISRIKKISPGAAIDLSGVPTGIYLLNITFSEKQGNKVFKIIHLAE